MSCTLESGAERSMEYGVLKFGSLDQVMIDDDLGWPNEAKSRGAAGFEGCSTSRAWVARSSK